MAKEVRGAGARTGRVAPRARQLNGSRESDETLVDTQKLVKMVNEIASFFEAESDRNVALEGIAGHLKRFWDPRMRREIVRHVDQQGGEGLKETALLAIRTHRDKLMPAEASVTK